MPLSGGPLQLEHELIVFQHPMQWFGAPALLKEWFDMVLRRGWAYGDRRALQGKHWLQAVSTSEPADTFGPDGRYGMTMEELLRPFEASARLCGMHWHDPFLVYRKATLDAAGLEQKGQAYRSRLEEIGQAQREATP
jgi:glutathione-regulated potassium-efflux system ancillary protein KefG